jgi:hypothetical protein
MIGADPWKRRGDEDRDRAAARHTERKGICVVCGVRERSAGRSDDAVTWGLSNSPRAFRAAHKILIGRAVHPAPAGSACDKVPPLNLSPPS